MLVGNYNYAGTSKFCTHILAEDERTTLCGIKPFEFVKGKRRGDWQVGEDDNKYCGCLKCKKKYNKTFVRLGE